MKICLTCGENKPLTQFGANGVISKKNPTKRYKPRCKPCEVVYMRTVYLTKLQTIIGTEPKCKICGYDRCFAALDFHHLDPSTKEFVVAEMKNYSLARLKNEIDKCVLICANCHREVHAGLLNI